VLANDTIMEIRSVSAFLDYYERIRGRTNSVIECIPDELYDWSPAPGKFSFADLMRHLAGTERYMFAENVRFRPSRYPGHGKELADGPDKVLEYFKRMHTDALDLFRELNDDDLEKKCMTPGGAKIAVWKWLRAMVEHEVHHRGQINLMLGINGVEAPQIFGLTSEEVRERSEPV